MLKQSSAYKKKKTVRNRKKTQAAAKPSIPGFGGAAKVTNRDRNFNRGPSVALPVNKQPVLST